MLTDHAQQAVAALGLECTIEKVTDINDIIAFGVVSTPALVVDGEIKVSGRVPSVDAIKALLV